MSRQFSLAYLTIPGIDPIHQIQIAREAGYDYVSLRTIPMGLEGEPQVHLEDDPALFRAVRQALKDCGMKLLDIELLRVREDLPSDYRPAFEKGAELGATQVLTSVWTRDHSFVVDRYGALCEQAAQFGLTLNLEFPIVSELTGMEQAFALQDRVGADNLKILMDMIYVHAPHRRHPRGDPGGGPRPVRDHPPVRLALRSGGTGNGGDRPGRPGVLRRGRRGPEGVPGGPAGKCVRHRAAQSEGAGAQGTGRTRQTLPGDRQGILCLQRTITEST